MHVNFRMYQAMDGIVGKLMGMAKSFLSGLVVYFVPQELIGLLCDDSTSCKEADANDDLPQTHTQL